MGRTSQTKQAGIEKDNKCAKKVKSGEKVKKVTENGQIG